jgi:phosphoserine phosphatase
VPVQWPFVLNVVGPGANPAALLDVAPHHGEPVTLKPGHASDIPFDGDPAAVLRAAREAAKNLDINVVPASNRRKKLLVADMDSTIVGCECLDEVAKLAGHGSAVAAITERAMRGEVDFAAALRERVALLKGAPIELLARVYAERVRLNAGAKALVATMRANGAKTILVSGGFTFFTERVAVDVGFDAQQANRLLDDGKRLTGEVAEPILGREAKLQALEQAVAKNGLTFDDALAVGDGANDLAMIKRAGLGAAYHAKPTVKEAAGAKIAHSDLTTLLYLQGYREEEIMRR